MNRGEEDYLKNIYKLQQEHKEFEYIELTIISKKIDHAVQTVNEMIKKMAKKKYLEYAPYKGVKLTYIGEKKAKQLVKYHKLWEVFLVDKLQMDLNQIHDIAEQLEHISNDNLITKLDEFLKNPDKCPHGDDIPRT